MFILFTTFFTFRSKIHLRQLLNKFKNFFRLMGNRPYPGRIGWMERWDAQQDERYTGTQDDSPSPTATHPSVIHLVTSITEHTCPPAFQLELNLFPSDIDPTQ